MHRGPSNRSSGTQNRSSCGRNGPIPENLSHGRANFEPSLSRAWAVTGSPQKNKASLRKDTLRLKTIFVWKFYVLKTNPTLQKMKATLFIAPHILPTEKNILQDKSFLYKTSSLSVQMYRDGTKKLFGRFTFPRFRVSPIPCRFGGAHTQKQGSSAAVVEEGRPPSGAAHQRGKKTEPKARLCICRYSKSNHSSIKEETNEMVNQIFCMCFKMFKKLTCVFGHARSSEKNIRFQITGLAYEVRETK